MEVGFGFAVTGAVIAAAGGLLFLRARHVDRELITAPGEVVAVAKSTTGDGTVSYVPIVQFAARDGLTIKFTDRLGTNPPSHEVGEQVTVSYDPADPDGARIAGGIFFLPMLIAAIGGVFLVGGLIVMLIAAIV